ncbi:hypothetical protein DSL72_007608 [Monilinia vaccinii-corymbosi]|uniref:Uncharacterized protein n=1 Tax=Monilinia vaccinii-corymbosi TaxID=61207 RepID=A0A8A3PI47_9HELO|nr:hypothetical protein DSL72_007608 [Monilinia vaccinii-corymbosi]
MDQWLRPVFTRTRTPVQSAPSDRAEDAQEAEDNMRSIRSGSRVSSYIGFRSGTANLQTPDAFPFHHVNSPEDVYHKPSSSQMAETLKVVMMTRNLMEPVPVEYNTCILHVLESYNDLQEQLAAKDGEIEEIKLRHTKDIGEFDVMGEQWKAKEKDYQKEIKNLEVLLSQTEGGMENVTMARSKSVIHGTRKAADLFEDGMEKIKQNFARYSAERGSSSTTTTTGWDIDPLQRPASPRTLETPTSASYLETQEDVFQERTVGSRNRERSTQDTESFYSAVDRQAGSRLTSLQLDALERQNATAEELGVVFDSSSESDDTSSRSVLTEGQAPPTPHRAPKLPNPSTSTSTSAGTGLRGSSKDKPLPDIPANRPEIDPFLAGEAGGAQPWVDTHSQLGDPATSLDSQKGFSFKAGDDTPSVLQKTSKYILDRKGNTVSNSRLSYVMNNEDEFVASPRMAEISSQVPLKPSKTGSTSTTPLSASPPGKEQESHTGLRAQLGMGLRKGIVRGDSTSSIVTAVRDNSGRSEGGRPARGNRNGNGNGNGNGAKKGQGTAVIAAVRAIAASHHTATANDRIQAYEFDRREGVPFSPERSPPGSQAGAYRG